MNLPKRLTSPSTMHVRLDNQDIPISFLPKDLIAEFALLDRMNAELADATYKVELLALATTAKRSLLVDSVSKYLLEMTPNAPKKSDDK